jgi:hypothetical protein
LCGLVCPSRTSEREGEGYCVKGGWREGEERVTTSVNPIPNPDPNPTQAPQMSPCLKFQVIKLQEHRSAYPASELMVKGR